MTETELLSPQRCTLSQSENIWINRNNKVTSGGIRTHNQTSQSGLALLQRAWWCFTAPPTLVICVCVSIFGGGFIAPSIYRSYAGSYAPPLQPSGEIISIFRWRSVNRSKSNRLLASYHSHYKTSLHHYLSVCLCLRSKQDEIPVVVQSHNIELVQHLDVGGGRLGIPIRVV